MSTYDPSGHGLFPEGQVEEPIRPCDSGEVDRDAQARADALYSAWLRQRRAEWKAKQEEGSP